MSPRFLTSLALLLGTVGVMAEAAMREAPNNQATAVNQLLVAGNACGPAALLNAFRCGSAPWQRALAGVAGDNDQEQLRTIIREIGMRPSKNLPGHPRWSRRGVSVADLRDMANEMVAGKYLPLLNDEVLAAGAREAPAALLRRVYQRFDRSLAKGLPPVVSLRRYGLRPVAGKPTDWRVIDAHFVTVTAVPRRLDKNARSFTVHYIDPLGGKRREGIIAVADFPAATGGADWLVADFPHTGVGKNQVRRGEESVLVVAAGIGRW